MLICIAGKNEISVNALSFLLNRLNIDKKDLLVLPNKNDIGIDDWQLSLKKYAKDNFITILKLEDLYSIEDLLFMSLECDKILRINKYKSKNLFNIHFSLLPKYKGMYTSVFPILNGDKKTGVTLHKIDNGIDTGAIIAQKKFTIDINDTCKDVYLKYLKFGFDLFKDQIYNLIKGNYKFVKQSPIDSTYNSKNSIDFNNININFNKTSFEIHNQFRAFIFEDYQLPLINNKKIIKSELKYEQIGRNKFIEFDNYFIISGIDGYKIKLHKKL